MCIFQEEILMSGNQYIITEDTVVKRVSNSLLEKQNMLLGHFDNTQDMILGD